MIINRHGKDTGELSKKQLIYAHEIGHWYMHPMYFKVQALIDKGSYALAFDADLGPYDDNMSPLDKAHWFAEDQANTFAKDIIAPRQYFIPRYREFLNNDHSPENVTKALNKTAYHFYISGFMAKQRARELGIEEADGTFLYADGKWYEPFIFPKHTLQLDQTFVINRKDHEKICREDKEYAELIRSGKFIYLGYVTCINDPKYVTVGKIRCKKTYHSDGQYYADTVTGLKLTEYGRHHVDECCLKFTVSCKKRYKGKHEYYNEGYLADELNASILTKKKCTNDLANQNVKDRQKGGQALRAEGRKLMKIMGELPTSFSGTLDYHIRHAAIKYTEDAGDGTTKEKKKRMTNYELYIRTGISTSYISKLRNNEDTAEKVELRMLCALCIALNLEPCFSRDLMSKAGKKFPNTESGYFQETVLEHYYTEPLDAVNLILKENGIAPWGKPIEE